MAQSEEVKIDPTGVVDSTPISLNINKANLITNRPEGKRSNKRVRFDSSCKAAEDTRADKTRASPVSKLSSGTSDK